VIGRRRDFFSTDDLQRAAAHLAAPAQDRSDDGLGVLVDEDPRPGGEGDDGVRVRLDRDDQIGIEVKRRTIMGGPL